MLKPEDIDSFKKMLEGNVFISSNGINVLNESNEPEKHSEDIQDIITKVPRWIVRWGIGLVFSSILVIVAISILIPYPNTVKSKVKLVSIDNTVLMSADTPGIITKVFVRKDIVVIKGQPLIEIKKETDEKKYIIKAPQNGKVGFSTIIQPNIRVDLKQEMIKIHPINAHFFGVMQIPKNNIRSIQVGQDVMIKPTDSFSDSGYTMFGKVDFVADEPLKDQFLVKVKFIKSFNKKEPEIKSWMEFEGQIITQKSNLFLKLFGGVLDVYNSF